jgi:hypothetical protein
MPFNAVTWSSTQKITSGPVCTMTILYYRTSVTFFLEDGSRSFLKVIASTEMKKTAQVHDMVYCLKLIVEQHNERSNQSGQSNLNDPS